MIDLPAVLERFKRLEISRRDDLWAPKMFELRATLCDGRPLNYVFAVDDEAQVCRLINDGISVP